MTDMSKEYAAALFMLASEENCCQEISESLALVSDIVQENEGYLALLASPAISIEDRLRAIDEAFGSLHMHVISFLKILCERSYIQYLMEAIKEFERLYALATQILTAKVTSAVPLTQDEESSLQKKLEAKFAHPVVLDAAVDAGILGGMIIEIDGKVIDASLRRRLGDIKDVISR
ncbi:MAG: ATP synthase F1 subunit delta [Clostridia bacterium]|nr:ATP synthase F1 subunit delta [Clostridia bacterium]